jgi:hypothetical protein
LLFLEALNAIVEILVPLKIFLRTLGTLWMLIIVQDKTPALRKEMLARFTLLTVGFY